MLKQVESVVQNSLSFLDNPYAKNILKVFLVLYAGLAAPRLPAFLAGLFNNALFRIVVLFLIAYLGLKDTSIALLSAVAFTLSIIFLKKAETTNSIYGALQSAVDTPQEWINDVVDDTQDIIDNALDTVQSGLGIDGSPIAGVVNTVKDTAQGLVDNVQRGFNEVYDGVQGMLPGASAAAVAAEVPTESAEAWTEDAAVAQEQEQEQEEEEVAQPTGGITGYDGSSFGSAL
jgi:phage-related protein